MCVKDVDGTRNNVDTDHTAPSGTCINGSDLSVPILRILMAKARLNMAKEVTQN